MKIVTFTEQISHYHDARFKSCAATLEGFSVVARSRDVMFAQLKAQGAPAYPLTSLFDTAEEYEAARRRGAIWKAVFAALSRLKADLVAVAGWSSPESLAAIAWAKVHGARVVIMGDSQAHDAQRDWLRENVKRRIVRLCDAALVAGSPHEAYIVALGMARARVFHGYDVVDNAYFAAGAAAARANETSWRAQLALPNRYILASARFVPKKNLPVLIGAYCQASARCDRAFDLVLLGDGPDRSAVDVAIAVQGAAGRIHTPGFRGYDHLPVYYGLAEAFVHVALWEQWGLVINEAAAAGLPIIAPHSAGATSALVEHERNGLVIDPQTPTQIADAIERIMSLSEPRRREMGVHSASLVACWGPERFATGLKAASQAAVGAATRPLMYWDRALFEFLSRRTAEGVS